MKDHQEISERLYAIVGAAMEVHNVLGGGLDELIYQEALATEFALRQLPFEREAYLDVWYKGVKLNKGFRADFICFNDIVVELKAVGKLLPEHRAQLFNYLRITHSKVGVLINFLGSRLAAERYLYNPSSDSFELLINSR